MKKQPQKLTPQEQYIKDSLKPHEAQSGYKPPVRKWDTDYRQAHLNPKNYR